MDRIGLADLVDAASRPLCVDGVTPVELVVVDLDQADWDIADEVASKLRRTRTPVVVGVSSAPLPTAATALLESLTCTLAPHGPGRAWTPPRAGDLEAIAAVVSRAPYAAATLTGVLDATAVASVRNGLLVESLAYSMLLASPEFVEWRASTPQGEPPVDQDDPVLLARSGSTLSVILNRPERHNAFGRALRDGVIEAMRLAETDASITEVLLTGAGRSFSSGGDLLEFGTAPPPSPAHLLRLQQSAGYAVHRVAERVRVVVHGASIGAGIEVPAFARDVRARENAWFRLPELGMGLIPGAGGTVSITRRIGKWRTAYMALTDRPIELDTALWWGLVDGRA